MIIRNKWRAKVLGKRPVNDFKFTLYWIKITAIETKR